MGRDCATDSQAIGRVCPRSRRQRLAAAGSRSPRRVAAAPEQSTTVGGNQTYRSPRSLTWFS
jgi:hypothetical protein